MARTTPQDKSNTNYIENKKTQSTGEGSTNYIGFFSSFLSFFIFVICIFIIVIGSIGLYFTKIGSSGILPTDTNIKPFGNNPFNPPDNTIIMNMIKDKEYFGLGKTINTFSQKSHINGKEFIHSLENSWIAKLRSLANPNTRMGNFGLYESSTFNATSAK